MASEEKLWHLYVPYQRLRLASLCLILWLQLVMHKQKIAAEIIIMKIMITIMADIQILNYYG